MLAALGGTTRPEAAALAGLTDDALTHALDLYRTAGLTALTDHAAAEATGTWIQVYVQPISWPKAEQDLATHLGPHLRQAENSGAVHAWWYVRKHPCWRIRLQHGPSGTPEGLRQAISRQLDLLQAEGVITAWWPGIYEPEAAALGGRHGIATAHRLFHADSRAILADSRWDTTSPSRPAVGRRELSMLLCSHMLRAAGQEWTEQADVWHRVAQMRPRTEAAADNANRLAATIGCLLAADTEALARPGAVLEHASTRVSAFHTAGQDLREAAQSGALTRGLRAVLAHLVIFHWNRAGIPAPAQGALARAARDHILGPKNDRNERAPERG
ncbi:thiopeptide-type bacteriocin biosynthesis protein [Kitasatospora purpeofusca]|uniref:thiopeptide-type bacteriocin biosynthesis protein n=1 Tax=Kitasatospora purpeofusca TaxID=67352 RepID=UPI002E11D6CD|nr:thiopeptide-type bacteriocin biosynthesis protein [Kitasatospora purpeofusca]